MSVKLDYQDFTGWTFADRPEYSFTDKTVTGSCFSQEKPDSVVFAPGTKNVRFIKCNLDNVALPPGSIIGAACSQRRFVVQNDLRDWEVDLSNVPVKVMNEKYWTMQKMSVSPTDIPAQKLIQKSGDDLILLLIDAGLGAKP